MSNQHQPKALFLLFAVQMWECFSFYGMRALLVLYMVNQLGLSDMHAYGVYAIYGALVEFGGIIGGRIADKILGLRQAIFLGGCLIVLGHLCMALNGENVLLFLGLALIVVGSGLFSTNISALLGLFYEEDDQRREQGFTWFYVGINVGAFLASILCGVIGETYGWHYGFGLAAIGMMAGNVLLYACRHVLEDKGMPPKNVQIKQFFALGVLLCTAVPLCMGMIMYEDIFMEILPWAAALFIGYFCMKMYKSGEFPLVKLAGLGFYLAALTIFFAAEDQASTSLLLFSENHSTGTLWGVEVPSTVLLSLNPMTIILGGAFVSRLFQSQGGRVLTWRVSAGLVLAAAVFAMFMILCQVAGEGLISFSWIFGGIVVMSLAELLLAPAIYAYFSELSPKDWLGVTMGFIPIGYSLASLVSGFFSKSMASEGDVVQNLAVYSGGFGQIALWLALTTAVIISADFAVKSKTRVSN